MAFSDEDSEAVYQAKEKLNKIKENPQKALFSDFEGESKNSAVRVEVDVLGRMTNVQIRPGSCYEGSELQLQADINEANNAARKYADLLEFDRSSLAQELDQAPGVKQQLEQDERSRSAQDRSDDDFFEDPLGFRRGR